MEEFDFVVIGSGPGGTAAAFRAASAGANTCIVEESLVGGVCLNTGCIPTKLLLRGSCLFSQLKKLSEWGIHVGDVTLDFKELQRKKGRVVDALGKSLKELLIEKQVTVFEGRAVLKGPGELLLSSPGGKRESIRAKKIIIATGTRPLIPKGFPLDGKRVLTSDEALQMESLPKSLLVVGGGFVGCEFACMFCQFGVEVTLVEQRDGVLGEMDESLGSGLAKVFKRMGMEVLTGRRVESLRLKEGAVKVQVTEEILETEKVMVCLGRIPNTKDMGLETLGIEVDEHGYVRVDEHCQTTVAGVYAVGDIINKKQLANIAFRQGVVAVEHALGLDSRMDYSVIPACVFTQPEVATVGLSEEEARGRGKELKVETFQLRWMGKAWVYGETEGFLKVVADSATGEILGTHIFGPGASELIGEAALALKTRLTLKDLATQMPIHPSYSETLTEVSKDLLGVGIYG